MKVRNILIASAIVLSVFSGKVMAAGNANATVDKIGTTIIASTTSDSNIKVFPARTDVAVDKKWTLKFNKQLNSQTVKKDNIQILDSNGQPVSVTVQLNSDNMSIDVLPPSSKYTNGQTYSMIVKRSLLSKGNAQLSQEVRMNFTITSGSTNVDPTLIEAQNGLTKVQDIVKTQAEKNLVSALKSAIDAKINNSAAVIDTAAIKAQFNSLSPDEQSDFKNAILGNFSLGTLLQIKSMLQ